MKNKFRKRFFIIAFFFLSMTANVFAKTQYDYYDDGYVAGGANRAFNAIIIGVIIIVSIIVIGVVISGIIKTYYFINPKADPEHAKKEKEKQRAAYENRMRAQAIPEAIDLGLTVKWASFNLGAYKPSDIGCRFYWGDNEPSVAGVCKNVSTLLGPLKKGICVNIIGDITGNPQYDAARNMLGDNWRMPTVEECEELIKYCTWEIKYVDGVKGQLITGKNGNSIFLPFNFKRIDEYTNGFYWTSQPSFKKAWYGSSYLLRFGRNSANPAEVGLSSAYGVLSNGIRPVLSNSKPPKIDLKEIQLQYAQIPNIEAHDIENVYKKYDEISEIREDEAVEEYTLSGERVYNFYKEKTLTDKYGVIYSADGKRLLSTFGCTEKKYKIREGTEIVCTDAFVNYFFGGRNPICETLVLPTSLIYISRTAFPDECRLKIESESKYYSVINSLLIDNRRKSIIKCLDSFVQHVYICDPIREISENAFNGCEAIRSVDLPDSLVKIGNRAFINCLSLEKINFPSSIIEIGSGAFWNCTSLKIEKIPETAKAIASDAFYGCQINCQK